MTQYLWWSRHSQNPSQKKSNQRRINPLKINLKTRLNQKQSPKKSQRNSLNKQRPRRITLSKSSE